jgi:transposase-like protein
MGSHPARLQAIRRCLDEGEPPARVAAELGVAPSTLRGWMRWARLERERDEQTLRQRRIEQELALAAEQLELLRQRLDQAEHTGEG